MEKVAVTAIGLAMGYVLSRIGFSSWDEVHAMFTFADLRMLGSFALAVAVLAMAWPIIHRMAVNDPSSSPRPIHPGTLAGGLIFGAGWAISGACPSIALVQIGEGQLGGLATLVGIFAGNAIYGLVHERFFGWTVGSCTDD